jgi:hypothetical protein
VRTSRTKILVISSAVLLISSPSFASKARLGALQYSSFWKDTQTIFTYPQYAGDLGQFATVELGVNGAATSSGLGNNHAEGGFQRKFMDGEGGVYLGHNDPFVFSGLTGSTQQQNPFYLYWGNGNLGAGLNLSYSNANSTGKKDLGLGFSVGTKLGDLELGLVANVYTKGETAGVSTKVLPDIELNANDQMGDLWIYGGANVTRVDNGASATNYGVNVGVQDHAFKLGQTGTFYYGVQVGYTKTAGVPNDTKNFNLPVYAGIEADVASWAVLRGSFSQTLFGYNDAGTGKDWNGASTTVAGGVGLKFGSFDIDSLLVAANGSAVNASGVGAGVVNGLSLATNLGLTYHL